MPTLVNNLRAIRGPVTAVPMVGASGVIVEPDTVNNQVVVRADETVLWEGTYSGAVNSSNYITLSESAANFDRIRIINGGGYKSCYEYSGQSTCWSYMQTFADNNETVIYALRFDLSDNGTKVTCANANFFKTYANGVSNWQNQSSRTAGENTLIKVIGINRIANN